VKFDRAIATSQRPVLLPLQRSPFRDLTVEEFLGGKLLTCGGPGGCRSVFMGSPLTLGQIADACVYLGGGELLSQRGIAVRDVALASGNLLPAGGAR
jgi:hypothetical protein